MDEPASGRGVRDGQTDGSIWVGGRLSGRMGGLDNMTGWADGMTNGLGCTVGGWIKKVRIGKIIPLRAVQLFHTVASLNDSSPVCFFTIIVKPDYKSSL